MKLTPGRVSAAVLSAAMSVALWCYWKNALALDALRAESSHLRTELNGPAGSRGFQALVAPAPKASGESPAGRSRADDAALAEFAKLSPEEQTAFLRRWKQEVAANRAAAEAAKAREEATAKAIPEMAEALAKRNKGPQAAPYAGGKATGAPDAGETGGDSSNTWCAAPRSDAGQWLKLLYGKPVEIKELAIHESYSTGALARVVAMVDGKEKVIWEGTEPVEPPPVQRIVKVPPGVRSDQIRIELDTTRTDNWQEIDAVEMVGRDGSRQWAKQAEGSSYWGGGNSYGVR